MEKSSPSTSDGFEKQCDPIQLPDYEAPVEYELSRQISEAQIERGLRRPSKVDASQESPAHDTRTIRNFRWLLICLALYASVFMYGLDTTIAADIQAAVVETFGSVDQLAWLGAGFPLGSVAVILPYGSLFASFNMKWLYIVGIVIFQAGSALCGGAPNMGALIVGRVLAGLGGTGMYLGGLNYFSSLTSPKERANYITGIAFVWGIGSILGPVVGGAFSISRASWRWAFYLNLVIGAVTAPLYLFFLPSVRPAMAASYIDILSPDYVGFVLSTAIWVSFGLVLVSAGDLWAWYDGRTIAMFVVFGVLLIAYVLQQYFCIFTTPATRSFPGHLLRSRTQVLIYIATSATITTLFVPTYYIPVYFQFVQSDSALMAAVRLLPFILVTVIVNLASGFMLVKVKYYMPFYLVSGILITLSGALLYVYLKPATPTSNIYGFTVIGALGTGLTLQLGYAVASLKADVKDIINAINLQNVSQIGSTMIALVIAGQVFQSVAVQNLRTVLAGQGFSEMDIHSAVAGAQSALFENLSGELKEKAILAITGAIQSVFILIPVAGALLVVVGGLMKREVILEETTVA